MIKIYTLDEKGTLQILNVSLKDAILFLICDNNACFKYDYGGLKFLTMGEFEECSQMDIDQRKLYYELKEN